MGMGLDRQHKEYRPVLLGKKVYFGNEKGDQHYWHDMNLATGRVMQSLDPELMRKRVGASTGAVFLCRRGYDTLPTAWKEKIAAEYVIIRQDEAVKRARTDPPDAPQLPAFGHKPAL